MRLIRGSAFLTLAVLLVTSMNTPANAAVKPGQGCTKLKAVVIQGGKTYTCIKSGPKKVWSKGITFKPTSKPTPTQPPEPVVPKTPTGFDDLVENYSGISYAAWKKSRDSILATSSRDPKFTFYLGPNTKPSYPNDSTAFDLVARMHPQSALAKDLSVILFNFQDREWAKAKMETLGFGKDSAWVTESGCVTVPTCWGGAVFADKEGRLILMETSGTDRNHTQGTLQAHEFAHTLQLWAISSWITTQAGKPWPPTWTIEGYAEFAQHAAIYYDSYDKYMEARRETSQDLFKDSIHNSAYIEEYFQINQSADWWDKYPRWRQYDLGAMFMEVLVAIKGPESAMELYRMASSGTGFAVAFEQVYGLPFAQALPIISKAIALEVGHN